MNPDANDQVEQLLAELAASDAPPASVVSAAINAYTWRDVDAELLELLSDSALADTAGLRAVSLDSRTVSMSVAGVLASVDLLDEGLTIRVLGELSGPVESIVVQTPTERVVVPLDADHCFDAVVNRPGPVRVVFAAAGRTLSTTWLTI